MSSTTAHTQASPIEARLVELPELPVQEGAGPTLLGANAKLLDSIGVSLSVMVGQAQTTLGELMRLKEGAVLKVDRDVNLPLDVLVNGNVVARGQLVVVDDCFGVRVTEVALPTAA